MINLDDTRTLLGVVERSLKPTTTLIDTFFPEEKTFITEYVEMEYRKGARRMAPFVVPGTKGVNLARTGTKVRTYKAPLMKPKRVIEASDIMRRGFGETVYSQRTPAERAQELRAKDMAELIESCVRRQEWMAAQILINGSCQIKGFADDGKTEVVDTISFDFDNKITISGSGLTWDNVTTAKPYDDIESASQTIRRNAGLIPTVAICSANVAKYLINNEQLRQYMLVPSRDNLAMLSIQPRLVRPDLMRVGYISALSLDVYAYDGGYEDEDGSFTPYIPDDHMIIGIPGRGKRLFGAVTQLEPDGEYHTFEGAYIPKVTLDLESDTSSLAMSSRCVVCPEFMDDWAVLKVK